MTHAPHNVEPCSADELKYLDLLARRFPTIADAATEVVNLEAILNLPKGTEHFLTDLHGESEAFQHVLKNASGVIRQKIDELFGHTLRESEKRELCTLIYYPEEKIERVKRHEEELDDWYRITMNQLVEVCRYVSTKYTRSKVYKALPADFSYIIQELLHESGSRDMPNKQDYFNAILQSVIEVDRADEFIAAISHVIQQLTVDRLHIIGDVFDRGPGPHRILDTLLNYHKVDIQWGNHDVLWMGAAAGNEASLANVVRISARYANLDVLENGYGINLLPLARLAMEVYGDDPCTRFAPRMLQDSRLNERDARLTTQMHKAVTVIQFKLEGQLIRRHPEYGMEDRLLLDKMDLQRGTVRIGDEEYPLNDTFFPTVDPADPYRLTEDENEVVQQLRMAFRNSEKLQKHVRFLYSKGSLYLVLNSNLLYHASIPMNADGTFKEVSVCGKMRAGRDLLDRVDRLAREAYFGRKGSDRRREALDYMWYLWCGSDSPLFDKDKMAAFEAYFVDDKRARAERKGAYYTHMEDPATCAMILRAFGLDPATSHIISGHIPVKSGKGESPIKAGGRLLMIDGGFSKAYQSETGIAGYTLIYNSHGLQLVQHQPFESRRRAIEEGLDILSTKFVVEATTSRLTVRDTTVGKELQVQIEDLKRLLAAYRSGVVKERK
ncbi:MAG: fructose-1,6-bisphosphatase [Alistipes senegalensis]|nr:fructose-1,6-bisphosphatase [Bacteroides cellulosilyticus]MCM1352131.1 fructose-1,6-bisphosphatase [Alistipes senegalensis]